MKLNVVFIILVCIGLLYFGWKVLSDSRERDQENPFEYSIDEYEKIDPSLIQYTQIRQIPFQANELYGIAVGATDKLYVTGDRFLSVLVSDSTVNTINLKESAHCVSVDTNEDVYLSTQQGILIYDSLGNMKSIWPGWR